MLKPLRQFANVKTGEGTLLIVACLYFYLLLCAYYIIRPIRNEMVIQNGVANIQWLLLAAALIMVTITPVFGWLTSRFKTRQFISYCSIFFISNLFVFFILFSQVEQIKHSVWVSRSFYVWVNVFNMFMLSLFWSFMNDIFSREQTTRLFAVIAAGGTAGALTGPIITTQLVESVGLSYLLLISALILSLTLFCIYQLSMRAADISSDGETNIQEKGALKGGVLDGIKFTFSSPYLRMIACFVIVFAVISTFLSIQLAETIEAVFSDSEQRTKLFSQADLITNVLTLLFQLSITGKLIRWLGYRNTLLLLPVGLTIGFVLVGFSPIFLSLIALSVFSRAGKYAILNPTSEMLFSVLSREEKYKAKNFIDTTIVRSSNVLSSWLFAGVKALGAGAAGVAVLGASLGIAWCLISYWLGNKYQLESTQKPYLVKEEK